ncbi:MAG: ATP-dependent DNA helicase RecG [Acidimicrobiales bacterium]
MSGRKLSQLAKIPVSELKGAGPKKVEALAVMEIETVLDLLTHYPRRYIDRTRQASIRELKVGEEGMVLATVRKVGMRPTRQRRTIVEIEVSDGTGYLRCVFFNQPWLRNRLSVGMDVLLFGKVEMYRSRRQMTSPVLDLIGDETGRIVPIYPQSGKAGLTTRDFGKWIGEALQRAGEFADPLPEAWRDRLDLVDRGWAFNHIHNPESMGAAEASRRRLVVDELLRMQLALVMRKRAIERESKGVRHRTEGELVRRFHAALPFPLTGAQERAIAEIARDLAGPHPMHRLLQGDVGSGKTLVAVTALLMGVQGGYQGAFMAPTEVLAEQHGLAVAAVLGDLAVPDERTLSGDRPLRVALLTNRTKASERTRILAGLADGTVDLLIGTHALLEERVEFASLGVVVIDEQHRFGVEQRAALRGKGDDPDVLVMTATPIPRTAAMTVYGDLDVTVLDEMPPGRQPIVTRWLRGELEQSEAYGRVAEEVAAGRQAYVVCPLVEESEKIQARSAVAEYERLAGEVWPDLRVGLLHGQMPSKEKEAVMGAFRSGELDVLVATTVIEVGVDVPNATVMIVEDADRFGMAQLHQLRGRVGRGTAGSFCYLLGEASTPESEERLAALERSTDGFELAEVDLDIRGEGTVLGTRQKGHSDLKLASLRRDRVWVARAREIAFDIVDHDPGLARHGLLREEMGLLIDPEEEEFLFKS